MSSTRVTRAQERARKWRPRFHPLTPALLAVVWILLWGVLTPAAAVGGFLLGLVVVLVFPLPRLSLGVRIRPWPLLVLIGYFLVDLVKASVHVAISASTPWIRPQGRILTVPLRSDHDLFGVLTAELTALVPGSIVIDLDTSRREMVVHVFDESAGDDADSSGDSEQEERIRDLEERDAFAKRLREKDKEKTEKKEQLYFQSLYSCMTKTYMEIKRN